MGKLSSILGGVGEAEVYGNGKFILPGVHKFEVQNIAIDPSKKSAGTFWFHVELKVLETNNTEMTVGETRTYSVKIPPGPPEMTEKKMAFSNMKAFVQGLDPSLSAPEITESVFEAMCEPEQPSRGEVICCEAWHQDNVNKPGKFTKTRWYSGNTEVE